MKLVQDSSAKPFAKSPQPWGKRGVTALIACLLLGGFLRVYDIGGPSFSDDEVYKVNAVESYRRGQWTLTGDDEHPLALKLLIYTSCAVRDVWNKYVAKESTVIDVGLESATRGPNALIGTFTALLLAFLGRELFSRRIGLVAALLWSTNLIAIGYSRIAKEDTLLAFFLTWAFYFVIRAKRMAEIGDRLREQRYEVCTAVAVGLLCASKYFFHLVLPIPLFYFWSRHAHQSSWHISAKRWLALSGIAVASFLVCNPTCLAPSNLSYIGHYLHEGTVTTHGYLFLDRLYFNNAFEALSGGQGTPWYFYFVYIGLKLALPIVGAMILGFMVALWRRHEDGPRVLFSWLAIWFLVHGLLSGAKWGRFTTHLLPPLILLAALGLDAAARALVGLLERMFAAPIRVGPGLAVLASIALVPELGAAMESAPHYRMYLNSLGGGEERLRHDFPHCDLYDVGVREAMYYICARAETGSEVRTDAPVVSLHYAKICGRPDLKIGPLSEPSSTCVSGSCYQVLQIGRTFFETKTLFESLHAQRAPDAIVRARGLNVAEIYGPDKLGGQAVSIHTWHDASWAGQSARTSPQQTVVSALAFEGPYEPQNYRLAAVSPGLRTDRSAIVEEIAPEPQPLPKPID